MPFFVLFLIVAFAGPLAAQAPDPKFQSGWSPNRYKIACDDPEACHLNEGTRKAVEKLVPVAVNDVKTMGFRTPTWWATRRSGGPDGEEYIELRESGENNVAFVSCQAWHEGGPIVQATMNIGNRFAYFRDYDAEYWNYNFVTHELFHLIQYEYPYWDASKCGNVPGWVQESTATAFANHMMRKRYPSVWPSKRNKEEVRDMAGLRRYDETLPIRVFKDSKEVTSGLPIYQRISSFWRHVAYAHHNDKYDFLAKYMMRQAVAGDWVGWLRDNVQEATGTPLGLVFSGFLADFAGWGDRGYPGGLFGRKEWLREAFGSCKTIYLNREEPVDYVELDIKPIAGNCIDVTVAAMGPNGIAEGESAAVQVAAMIMAGPPSSRGGLHLALAASNDKTNFLCAREVKRSRRTGVGKCMFNPDDGKLRLGGGEVDARVWNVIAQEKGDPKELRQEAGEDSGSGELRNLYTVSYTPTSISMRDSGYDSKSSIFVRMYFILDLAKVVVDGQQKKGAVGTFARGGDPQTTLPKQDASGNRVNSFSKPDRFQPAIPVSLTPPPEAEGKLSHFFVGTSADNADSSSTVLLLPARENAKGELEGYPLSVGETGTFPLSMQASLDGEPAVGLRDASLVVEEFTDLVFRARYQGSLCRHKDVIPTPPGTPPGDPCKAPFPISGEIVKAFAGSRLPGRYLVVERTEGTEMYRKANEQGMAGWSIATESEANPGPGSAGPAASGGAGSGTIEECACTCEERSGFLRRAEELKARQQAGEKVSAGEIMALMRCDAPCRPQYAICVMQEDELKKQQELAEQAAQQQRLQQECDCSCDALRALQGRTEELLEALQTGSPGAMDEMQKVGNCINVCQGALMSCGQ